MLRVRCDTKVCDVVQCFTMTSPYFTQSRYVVTGIGNQSAAGSPAASLRSKLTKRTKKVDPAAVKEEEEEAKISGNVYVRS